MKIKHLIYVTILMLVLLTTSGNLFAEGSPELSVNVDLYNRYVWRGLDIANTPSMQPTLAWSSAGFEFGIWGAYTMSNQTSESDEIDFWLGYTFGMKNGSSITLLATDYYFPNAGIKFFNFNNHDNIKIVLTDTLPDPGAHLIELGISYTGPESFPVTVSGYMNVYNEAGNNTYFQIDYPVKIGASELSLFAGAAGGSEDNPDYYGTDGFNLINIGVSTAKEIEISEKLSIPLNLTFGINPNDEFAYFLAGFSF